MGSRRVESMRAASQVSDAIAVKRTVTVEHQTVLDDLFWGTRKPTTNGVSSPSRSRSSSPSKGKMKSTLRLKSHRLLLAMDQLAEPEEPAHAPVPAEATKKVKRDVFGKVIYDGPKYVPGDRAQQFNPEHTNRSAVFKEDLGKALKSDDVPTILAVYSMALDMDAANHNTTLMFATRHEIEGIKKRLRLLLKKRIDPAVRDGDIDALRAIFEEVDKDQLLKAVCVFPEVHRGRSCLKLLSAHRNLQNHNGNDEKAKEHKVKALEVATRRARLVRALTAHVTDSNALLDRHGGGTFEATEPGVETRNPFTSEAATEKQEEYDEEGEYGVGEEGEDGVGEEGDEEVFEAGEEEFGEAGEEEYEEY